MKKIFLIITILVLAITVKAQYTNNVTQGNAQTLWGQAGGISAGYGYQIKNFFNDTTAANSSSISGVTGGLKNIAGFIIRTADDSYWARSNNLQIWNKINGGVVATPTWQQTLTAGSTLNTDNTISGGGFDFTWNNTDNLVFNTVGSFGSTSSTGGLSTTISNSPSNINLTSQSGAGISSFRMYYDTVIIEPHVGRLIIDTLNNETFQNSLMGWTTTSGANRGKVGYITLGSGLSLASGVLNTSSSLTVPINNIAPATGTNSINNAGFGQTWAWNSLTTSAGLTLNATTTGTAPGGQKLVSIFIDGVNSVASRTSYALQVANGKTGTTPINYGILSQVTGGASNYGIELQITGGTNGTGVRSLVTGTTGNNVGGEFTATGGSSNIAIAALRGSVNLGTVGTESGVLKFNGSTSGTITIQPAAAAGTWTMTLPTTDGASGEFLQTNGSGVLTWAAAGGALTPWTSNIDADTYNLTDVGVLGVGTASPTAGYKLDVQGSGTLVKIESTNYANPLTITNPNGSMFFTVGSIFSNNAIGLNSNSNYVELQTNGVERWRVANTSGNLSNTGANGTSSLHVNGSVAFAYRKVTADAYVITATDYTLDVDNTTNNWTITLPDAATCTGRIYVIKRFDENSSGTITVGTAGGDVQNPNNLSYASTQDLGAIGTFYQSVMYQSTGTNYAVIK